MPRKKTIRDEQIIEAAREVFLESGMNATTSEIARRAGVSEGTIFNRFESKHDLMLAAMGVDDGPIWFEPVERGDYDDLPIEEGLTQIGEQMLDFFEKLIPRIMMIASMGQGVSGKFIDAKAPPLRGLRAMTNYLYKAQREGKIRSRDPEIVARQFIGTLHFWAFAEHSGINDFMPMPRATYLRGVIHNTLEGLRIDGD